MHFEEWMEDIVKGFEVVGVAVLAFGSAFALVKAAISWLRHEDKAYVEARRNVGRAILLGLEILIIADIVRTITIEQSAESVLVLGVIVLVRTFLSFSLDIEMDGVVPWRRAVIEDVRAARGLAEVAPGE